MSKPSLIYLFPVIFTFAACNAAKDPKDAPPRTVLVTPAVLTKGEAGIATGVVRGEAEAVVGAVAGGRVTSLLVDVGESVVKGQRLAQLDAGPAQLRVRQAQAEVDRATANAELKDRNSARTLALHDNAAASDSELEAARGEARVAAAEREAAVSALALARRDASEVVLFAPISGVVAARSARLGGILAPGEGAFEIEGLGARRIDVVLPVDVAANLDRGSRISFRYPGGTGEAKLEGISSRATAGGSGRRAVFTVVSGTPAPGTAVELTTPGNDDTGVRVPLAAVQQPRGGTPSVFVVDADKRLRAVPVRLTAITGAYALVTGKIAQGNLVVAAGGEFLEAGLNVRPQRAQR